MDQQFLNKITILRKKLHKFPELSNQEIKTPEILDDFFQEFSPDQTIKNIGGYGIAFVFKGKKPGPCIVFRADMDALPINEINDFSYKSVHDNVAHKCGHDGHMAIISGLGALISKKRPEKGKVVLLYQPAEETGEGAYRVVTDEKFKQLQPDYIFGLHNLPGYEKNAIILSDAHFAAASKGMIIQLKGKTSHAGEPENGISPAIGMSDIIKELMAIPESKKLFRDFALVTIIHAKLGERAFGTNPGFAQVMATLRTFLNDDMNTLTNKAEKCAEEIAAREKLGIDISYTEEFPATVNYHECVEIIRKKALKKNFQIIEKNIPFRWSEDFAHFLLHYKGAFFGLGSGKNYPQLHNPDYDFPDELTATGIKLFFELYKYYLNIN